MNYVKTMERNWAIFVGSRLSLAYDILRGLYSDGYIQINNESSLDQPTKIQQHRVDTDKNEVDDTPVTGVSNLDLV
jgi:hypothetical protein